METFSTLLAICAGNSPVTGEFPAQRPVMRSFGVFFDLRLNKRLSKQSWDWWFETLSRPLWRHCNEHISNQGRSQSLQPRDLNPEKLGSVYLLLTLSAGTLVQTFPLLLLQLSSVNACARLRSAGDIASSTESFISTLCALIIFKQHKCYCISTISLHFGGEVISYDLYIQHSWYHHRDCRWFGDEMRQDMSSHGLG